MSNRISRELAAIAAVARVGKSGPDAADVREAFDAYHHNGRAGQLVREASRDGALGDFAAAMGNRGAYGRHQRHPAKMAGGRYAGTGQETARRSNTIDTTRVPHYPADPACQFPQDCGGDILGFNSLELGQFPIPAPVAPAVIDAREINVGSQTADKYTPRYLFWQARRTDDLEVVTGLLVSAFVGPAQQTIGAGNFNAITADVFALTNAPLPVGWDPFRNIDGQTLRMIFGNFFPIDVQIFGVLWGDAGVVGR